MCNHENLSHATSSDWETVCADCGEVIAGITDEQHVSEETTAAEESEESE